MNETGWKTALAQCVAVISLLTLFVVAVYDKPQPQPMFSEEYLRNQYHTVVYLDDEIENYVFYVNDPEYPSDLAAEEARCSGTRDWYNKAIKQYMGPAKYYLPWHLDPVDERFDCLRPKATVVVVYPEGMYRTDWVGVDFLTQP